MRQSMPSPAASAEPAAKDASPLHSVLYMNRLALTERGEAFRAHVVSYADDFVILSRGHAASHHHLGSGNG
jgi:RNA-directed DNA polymerase